MNVRFETRYLKKRFPLRISRGIKEGSHNLFVFVEKNGLTGIGEMAPGSSEGAENPEIGQAALEKLLESNIDGLSIWQVYDLAMEKEVPPCAIAALDLAMWDLLAKSAKLPL